MLIDARPIRDKARRDYEKVLRDLETARHDLERFERHDKPAFDRWLSRQFGALITELRETSQKLAVQRELLFEVETEALLSDSSHTRAYERVMWRRAHPEEEEASKNQPNGSSDDQDPDADPSGPDPFEEAFKSFFGDGENEPSGRGGRTNRRAPREGAQSKAVPPRLKDLYRAVVRKLHPDAQQAMTAQKKEWWHQAQAAYQSGDVERLQVILTLCEIEEQGTTAKTTVSLLMRITREFKNTLRTLKRQLTEHRCEPAWNFSNLSDHSHLVSRIEGGLRSDLFEMKRALDAINAQLAMWARQAKMSRPRPNRRARSWSHPEFFF